MDNVQKTFVRIKLSLLRRKIILEKSQNHNVYHLLIHSIRTVDHIASIRYCFTIVDTMFDVMSLEENHFIDLFLFQYCYPAKIFWSYCKTHISRVMLAVDIGLERESYLILRNKHISWISSHSPPCTVLSLRERTYHFQICIVKRVINRRTS
jgi:hypothetical protein